MSKTYKEIDKDFIHISNNLRLLSTLRPTNLSIEKNKFLNTKKRQNPEFNYSIDFESIKELQSMLDRIVVPDDEYHHLYKDKIEDYNKVLEIRRNIGTSQDLITEVSTELYGEVNQDHVELANREIVQNQESEDEAKSVFLEFDEIKKKLLEKAREWKIPLKVIEKDNGLNTVSVDSNFELFMSKSIRRRADSIDEMIYHELGVHLRRLHNGSKQARKIFMIGTAGYIRNEEGLAILYSKLETGREWTMTNPAKNLLILDHSIHNDFVSTFNFACSLGLSESTAWDRTYRVKRGLADQSKPGAFLKDQYYSYMLNVKKEYDQYPDYFDIMFKGKSDYHILKKYL